MAVLEARVDRLEETLSRFIEQTSLMIAAIHEDVAEIRASNARTDRLLLQMQQQADKDREEFSQRFSEMQQKADKDRASADKKWEEAEKDRKDFNKRLAEISDRVGRFVEDMVHPNAGRIARQLFGDDPVQTLAIRVKRRHPIDASRMLELDLLVAGESHLLVGEAKSTPNPEKADEFLQKVQTIPEYFPEYAGLQILPMLASVSFAPSLVAYLNRKKIYALGFGDETMELLNAGDF